MFFSNFNISLFTEPTKCIYGVHNKLFHYSYMFRYITFPSPGIFYTNVKFAKI
jgi:hypothetical protein